MKIKDLNGKLFSLKEMYETSCNRWGKLPLVKGSSHKKRKAQYENLHITNELDVTPEYGFPVLAPYTGTLDFELVAYPDRKQATGKGQFAHFFSDDYKWGYALWQRMEPAVFSLKKFDGMFSPDYSLYADDGFKMFNMIQTYKSRVVGAYAQSIGYNVIPTASCGDIDSLQYCYDGLPEHSVLGFCGTGLDTHAQCEHWEYAIRALDEMKSPTAIIVYGPERKVVGLKTQLIFKPDQITKFHRHEKS